MDAAAERPLLARDCVWEDYTTRIATGIDDVAEMLRAKPTAARPYAVERVANGDKSGGFTYHREDESGTRGLRGTVFIELNEAGEIQYVREMAEPLFKPGEAMIKFLQAVAKPKGDETPAEYEKRDPVGCPDVVRYIWKDSNGDMDEALRLMSDQVRYEDFNYPQPFLGKAQVAPFLDEFTLDLGIIFVAERISSEDDAACAFTWRVEFAGLDTPTTGVSFYAMDDAEPSKIGYIRDIPQPVGWKPLLDAATLLNPQLRRFGPAP